jgi:hypothetical protein
VGIHVFFRLGGDDLEGVMPGTSPGKTIEKIPTKMPNTA